MITLRRKIRIISIVLLLLLGVQIALSENYEAYDLILAKELYEQGKYEEALNIYNRLIEKSPQHIAIVFKSYTLSALKRYDEALETAEKAIKFCSLFPDVYNTKVNALVGLGRYDEAIDTLIKADEIGLPVTESQIRIDKIKKLQEKQANNGKASNNQIYQDNPNYNSDTVTSKSITSTPITSAKLLETGL